jgi:uncharacterized protein DUF2849
MTTHILTANHLVEGHVVFLGENGIWVSNVNDAVRASSPEDKTHLDQSGNAAKAANLVIETYLVEVEANENAIIPVKTRERMRTLGPTVRPDLGYQSGTWKPESYADTGDEIVHL